MFDFTVRPDGAEPFDVTATTRDVVTWEAGGKNRSFSQFQEHMRMGDMYALAHAAAVRQGLFRQDLATFTATCDLDFTNEDEAGPTSAEPSPDGS